MVLVDDALRRGSDVDFSLMPWLFPQAQRPSVVAFGRFVRLADGIAGNAFLTRDDRVERLLLLENALAGGGRVSWSDEADRIVNSLRDALIATGLSDSYAKDVLAAFRQDAAGISYRQWDDVLDYCRLAAAPTGRYLLDLMGEDQARCGPPSDALCCALRILKQLRDCQNAAINYNRLCIPRQYLADAMLSVDHLDVPKAKGQTRAVIDRVLDGVEHLLGTARPLPNLIRARGLSIHTRIVLCRAGKLMLACRHDDPLQKRVSLTWWQRQRCMLGGLSVGYRRSLTFSRR
jgi:phytoene/squalene synthetase